MEVMKFGDRAVARLQHLDIGLRGDRFDVVGGRREREAVHGFAPGPEAVGRVAAPFPSSPPWRAETRANAGCRSRERRSRSARRRSAAPRRARPRAIVAPSIRHPDIRGPALRRQRPLEMQRSSSAVPSRLTRICLYIKKPRKPRGEVGAMTAESGQTTIWRNARLATLRERRCQVSASSSAARSWRRGGRIVFAGPERDAPSSPTARGSSTARAAGSRPG